MGRQFRCCHRRWRRHREKCWNQRVLCLRRHLDEVINILNGR